MGGALRRMVGWEAAGAAAGAVGTLAMDLVWYGRAQRRGQEPGRFVAWETAEGLASWDAAPAPAKVARILVETVTDRPLDAIHARTATNVMHWATGIGWAAGAGVVAGAVGARSPFLGLPFGFAVWSASYLSLVPLGIYKWPWEYDAKTMWDDVSAHLVYGAVTGLVWSALRSTAR